MPSRLLAGRDDPELAVVSIHGRDSRSLEGQPITMSISEQFLHLYILYGHKQFYLENFNKWMLPMCDKRIVYFD